MPLYFLTISTCICLHTYSITVTLKKEEFDWRGGNTRTIQFHQLGGDNPTLKISGKTMQVSIGPGLPSSTRPSHQRLPATKGGQRPTKAAPSYQQSRGQQNLVSKCVYREGRANKGQWEISKLLMYTYMEAFLEVDYLKYSHVCVYM